MADSSWIEMSELGRSTCIVKGWDEKRQGREILWTNPRKEELTAYRQLVIRSAVTLLSVSTPTSNLRGQDRSCGLEPWVEELGRLHLGDEGELTEISGWLRGP